MAEKVQPTGGEGIKRVAALVAVVLFSSGCGWLCRRYASPVPEPEPAHSAPVAPEPLPATEIARTRGGGVVVAAPDPEAPDIALQIWAGRGSADQGEDNPGRAALCAQIFCEREAPSGISATGWASPDATVCELHAPRELAEDAVGHLGTLLTSPPSLSESRVEAECRRSQERWRRTRDRSERRLMELTFQTAFTDHPYEHPVLSPPRCEHLDLGIAQQCADWFDGEPVVVTAAGPVRAGELARALSRRGWRPRSESRRPSRSSTVDRREPRVAVATSGAPGAALALSFRFSQDDELSFAAVEVLARALGGSGSGRLEQSVAARSGRLMRPAVGVFYGRRGGALVLTALSEADDEAIEATARGLLWAAYSSRVASVRGGELERARRLARLARARSWATTEGLARALGQLALSRGVEEDAPVFSSLAGVSRDELGRAAERLLVSDRMTLALVVQEHRARRPSRLPLETGGDGEERIAVDRLRARLDRVIDGMSQILETEGPPESDAEVVQLRIPEGPLLLIRPEPRASSVAIRVSSPLAGAWQTFHAAGKLALLAKMITGLARERWRSASLGGLPRASPSPDALSVSAEVLPDELERGLDAALTSMLWPGLTQDSLDRCRSELSSLAIARRDDPRYLGDEALRRALHPGAPYGMTFPGSLPELDTTNIDQIHRIHGRAVRADRLIISVVGPVEPEGVLRTVSLALASAPGLSEDEPPPGQADEAQPPEVPEIRRIVPGERVVLGLGFTTSGLSEPRWRHLEVLFDLLHRGAGSLGQRLEDGGLAVDHEVELWQGARGGHLVLRVETLPGNEARVREVLEETISDLTSGSVAAEELRLARRRAAARHARRLSTPAGRAAALEAAALAGLPPADLLGAGPSLLEIEESALREVTATVFAPARRVLVVVGPEPVEESGDVEE